MAISITWGTKVIYIPRTDLTLIQASPEVRELDLDWFRLALKDLEDDEEGMPFPNTHNHVTETTLAGLTYARIIEIINDYTVEFEDGQYTVNCVGANHNLSDVKVANQVSLIVNNAAGLITNTAIEYASFNNKVSIDPNSSYTGTLFPVGTPQRPVNNLDDALLIAEYRGFIEIEFYDDYNIDSSYVLDGFAIRGRTSDVAISIDTSASVVGLKIENLTLANGILDGDVEARNCMIIDVSYINGLISNCGLSGDIILGGNNKSVILDCYTPDQDNPAVIDMGGSGNDLSMPNYSGIVTIKNLSGADNEIGIGLDSGYVILDSTITAGTVIISGVGLLQDNSGPSVALNTDGILNTNKIAETTWNAIGEKVYVNASSIYSGVEYPVGTSKYPVNNLTDAKSICEVKGIETIHIHGDITIDIDFEGYSFESHSVEACTINLGSQALDGCFFRNLSIEGYATGHCHYENCEILSGMSYCSAAMENCQLGGTFVAVGEGIEGDRCTSPQGVIFDLNGNSSVGQANFSGIASVGNATELTCTIAFTGSYILNLLSSCTSGTALIAGIGILNDLSNGLNVTQRVIPSSIWEDANALTILSQLAFINAIEGGKWEISGSEMIFYDDDNITEIARFTLGYDANGNPISRTRQ